MEFKEKLVADYLKSIRKIDLNGKTLFVGNYSGGESITVRIGEDQPFPVAMFDLIAFTYSKIK